MGSVEVVRSFAVAALPGGTIVLNLGSGTFFHVEQDATATVLDIARELPSGEIEERTAALRKIPRYVARERVRALQLQLASPFALASSPRPRLGADTFVEVGGSVQIAEAPGVLKQGDSIVLRGSALRTPEGVFFVGGPPGSGKSTTCQAFAQRGLHILDDGAVKLPVQKAPIALPLAQAWFLDAKRRSGMGLMLARRTPPYVMGQLLSHTCSSHARGAWVDLFKIYAALCEQLPAFRVSLPEGVAAVQQAVRDFAGGFGFRPEGPRVGC